MTFYQQEVNRLKQELYPNDYLVKQVMQAKKFMDKNYSSNLELKDIAGEAFFSKFHFIRLFKSLYGRTPYQYLKEVRIGKAKQLIQKGKPVTAACIAVGFDSPSSFTALFKRMTGSTPSAFQKRVIKKSQL
jgi:AraC-like DNA-binding protein